MTGAFLAAFLLLSPCAEPCKTGDYVNGRIAIKPLVVKGARFALLR
jgi:hypothetical protein